MGSFIALGLGVFLSPGIGTVLASAAEPRVQAIFPSEKKHNHASCVVETPRGDLLAAWYSGSGERKSDDVVIQGAWLPRGADRWTARFQMADTPGYPDCNPALFAPSNGSIWMFWPTILDHRWEGALLKYVVADVQPTPPGVPHWTRCGVLHVTPEPGLFAQAVENSTARLTAAEKERYASELSPFQVRSHDLLYQRLGWMPRVHPLALPSGRWVLPLYCDTFSMSLMLLSDDRGATWSTGQAMVGFGNIQPSVARMNDGTLVAFMRDNGPHRRIKRSTSKDEGRTWTPAVDMALPNPGAGIEAIRLMSGSWVLIYNDTESGRHSLAVSLSDDEGATWKWTRHLVRRAAGEGSFHYPSIIQAKDGSLHATFTHHLPDQGSTIMHARFEEDWIRTGDVAR
jgi:predicted neuraminidase